MKLKVKGAKAEVKWSGNNKNVATVDADGRVTAREAGKAVVSAKVYGKTLKCRIIVSEQNE